MRVIKSGKYTFVRHWFKWYFVHQKHGGSEAENNWLVRVDFPFKEEIE